MFTYKAVSENKAVSIFSNFSFLIPVFCILLLPHIGWEINGRETKLSGNGAMTLSVLATVAGIVFLCFSAFLMKWFGRTYQSSVDLKEGIRFIAYSMTPVFVSFLALLLPSFMFFVTFLSVAFMVSGIALFTQIKDVGGVSDDTAYMYAGSVLMVSLVAAVSILAGTIIALDSLGIALFA